MRALTLPEIETEIEITERDLRQLYRQRTQLLPKLRAEDRILEAMRQGITRRRDIQHTLIGMSPAVLDIQLRRLREAGVIVGEGNGRYALTDLQGKGF